MSLTATRCCVFAALFTIGTDRAESQAVTLPAAVERAAYIGGRCEQHMTAGDKAKAQMQVQGNGALTQQFLRGRTDSRRQPLTFSQCQTLLNKAQSDLESAFRPATSGR